MKKVLKIMSMVGVIAIMVIVACVGAKFNTKAMNNKNDNEISLCIEQKAYTKEEKIIRNKAKEFIQYFCNQQFEKAMEIADDDNCSVEEMQYIYDCDLKGNTYGICKDIIYHGFNEEEELYAVKAIVKGRYRTDEIILHFNKDYKVNEIWYNSSSPIPENGKYFKEEKINISEEFELEGLLTLPKNNKKAPVVILVHGTGYFNADESVGENRPFADIAHSLAEQGIATVRYNERFYQYGNLADGSETVYTEAIDDACTAVKQLANDSRINTDKIFVAGHSLGGMVTPKIAELCPEVDGIISLAGSPRRLVDIGREQGIISIKESPLYKTEEERKNAIEYINYYFDLIENLTEDSNEYLGQHSATFWRSTNNLDAKSSIEKLSIPMLILQGKDDFQVFADKDYVEWQKLLNGRDNCHFKLYDGLNHFFMKSNGYKIFDGNKEYLVPGHVDQRVLDDMAEFINMYSK